VKRRERMAGRREDGRQYGRMGESASWHEVGEGGHRFRVNLSDYLDTGLFLDHRITRARAAEDAAGKRVLNLFCYTGAFTVYVGAAGAAESTSVDLSTTYLDWAGENLALNALSADRHRLIKSDVKRFLDDAAASGERWDLAVVDPPTFSNSKAMDYVWDVQRDHGALLAAVARVLTPGGVLWFSTNRRRFALDDAALPGAAVDDLTQATTPPDFRSRPHRTWRFALPDRAARGLAPPAPRPGSTRSPAPPPRRDPRRPPARDE
jgi:23S rRNA G2069 N7-methylase RlmK/C1962 C5-methylase RlmI